MSDTQKWMNITRCFTETTSIVFLITCLTGISSVPFLINRHSSWREPINPYYVNTGYALAPATSANDSEQQSMSSDADTLSLTDSSVYVHVYRHTNTHGSILTTASWRNIPSESLERFNFTMPSRVNFTRIFFLQETCSQFCKRPDISAVEQKMRRQSSILHVIGSC